MKATCTAAIDSLRPHAPPTRWVKPEARHLTLKFLGNVSRAILDDLHAALTDTLRGRAPFSLCTGGLGCFGSARRPRVLWLGVEGELAPLAALHAATDEACARVGLPREDRPFRAHLTLGRVKRLHGPRPADWLAAVPAPASVSWEVTTVQVMESLLQPAGTEYRVLALCSLVI